MLSSSMIELNLNALNQVFKLTVGDSLFCCSGFWREKEVGSEA